MDREKIPWHRVVATILNFATFVGLVRVLALGIRTRVLVIDYDNGWYPLGSIKVNLAQLSSPSPVCGYALEAAQWYLGLILSSI